MAGCTPNIHVRNYWSPIERLPRWRRGERSPDMVGTGEIKYPGRTKQALLPGNLVWIFQGLEEENLDQKSPGPPGWGVDAAGQLLVHH